MPRYLVERTIPGAGELTAGELKAIAQQRLRVQQQMEADIQWIHSTITRDKMVCLFIADDEEIVREHSRRCALPVDQIHEVTAIIGPTMDALG